MMNKPLLYLASPYNHPDIEVRYQRYEAAIEATAHLMKDGHIVLSPIVLHHPLAYIYEMPLDWEFWKTADETILRRCDEMTVLTLDGWRESKGIQAELEICLMQGISVSMCSMIDGRYRIHEWK